VSILHGKLQILILSNLFDMNKKKPVKCEPAFFYFFSSHRPYLPLFQLKNSTYFELYPNLLYYGVNIINIIEGSMKRFTNLRMLCMMFIVSVISISIQAQSKSGDAVKNDSIKYTIENCINKFSLDKIEKTNVGYQYWFVDPNFADGKTLKMSVVAPHSATHPPHVHVEDEFFFILQGKAEVYLKGKWTPAEPYTSFYCPSNVEHGIRNAGDTELKYLVIKQYDITNPVRKEFMKSQKLDK
jgi:mannose-6-phosphate isomerase-like protein (cupin superfamily)